jgi:hypothetical protein
MGLLEAYSWIEEYRRGREHLFLQDVELQLEHLERFPLVGRVYRSRYRPIKFEEGCSTASGFDDAGERLDKKAAGESEGDHSRQHVQDRKCV